MNPENTDKRIKDNYTDKSIETGKRLAEKATKGRWVKQKCDATIPFSKPRPCWCVSIGLSDAKKDDQQWLVGTGEVLIVDAEHIAHHNPSHMLKLYGELESKDEIITNLQEEIEILRLYGNKGCTVMADERLAEISKHKEKKETK